MEDLLGAPDSDIRRLENWNRASMEGCYLTTLPRGAMRALSGFYPQGGMFYLERALINSPEGLKKIFSEVDKWIQKMKLGMEWSKIWQHVVFQSFKRNLGVLSSRCCMFEEEIPQQSSI